MPTKKVYVIGAGKDGNAIQTARKALQDVNGEIEIVCVESEEDIPLTERFSSDPSKIQHIHKFTAPPIVDIWVPEYKSKRKGHERPYKYHR